MADARFYSSHPNGWNVRLERCRATRVATRLEEVPGIMASAEAAARDGCWVAAAIAFDAAPAFDPSLRVRSEQSGFPLVWTAEFLDARPERLSDADTAGADEPSIPALQPTLDADEFASDVLRIQEHIRAGDTYQVNLTFPLRGTPATAADAWFRHLYGAQQPGYAAYLDLGDHVVLSLSPELFFERRGSVIRARPMKGTSARGRWKQEDDLRATTLAASDKARAENVMIVDLLRNDIGRIAETGSVSVPHLFAIERYPTLWQMTSTVEGHVASDVRLMDVLRALFPCGSVTGAPKIRTMEIIADTEHTPRGLYTGAIGLLEPGGACTFNVAIRTMVIDRRTSVASMGVGAGITLDSAPQEEYAECLLKAAFASSSHAGSLHRFALLETMRLEDGVVIRLDRHLSRMHSSAEYFGFPWNDAHVRDAVQEVRTAHLEGCWRVRLTLDHRGAATAMASPHAASTGVAWRLAFAQAPVDSGDPLLFNKTTNRTVYHRARRSRPDVDDVMLWNERGEVTESTIANVVVEIDGTRFTPPLECGLLPGVLRAELLDSGIVRERILSRGELARASRLWLINSLRGWIEATLVR